MTILSVSNAKFAAETNSFEVEIIVQEILIQKGCYALNHK